jgi:thiol-disulfide isomerase/thioredoxin
MRYLTGQPLFNMKCFFLLIAVLISLTTIGQKTTLSDSLKDAPLNKMLTFFKAVELKGLPTKEKTDIQYAEIKTFIKNNPKEPYSSQFISWGKYFDTLRIDTLYSLLDISLQHGIKESIKYQKIRSALTPGMIVPNLFPADTLSQPFNVSSLKGKIVFVDVWASWCGPCREEMPQLIKLYEHYKERGFVVIAISLDDNKTKWLTAISKDQQPWQQLCELKIWRNSSMLNKWGITGIPYNFLIDRDGKLIDKEIDLESLERKIQQLL